MEPAVKQEKLKAIVAELAKDIKTEKDLGALTQELIKLRVETALNAEHGQHLGYDKHDAGGRGSGNSRNGATPNRLKGQHGEAGIATPRDRNGTFSPQFVRKGQTRLTRMDHQILALYVKGICTRDIVEAFQEMYGAEISATLVSKLTERVIGQVVEWQNRPLEALYPVIYLDCIVLKIRQNKRVLNKSLYLALGINLEGHKELLGLWLAETEGERNGSGMSLCNCNSVGHGQYKGAYILAFAEATRCTVW